MFRNLVERHLEDTLIRAALLRWLKGDGKKSELGEQLPSILYYIRSKPGRKIIQMCSGGGSAGHGSQPKIWLGAKIQEIAKLLGKTTGSPVLIVFRLWLLARG